jgi:hypothetical protein
VLLVTASVFINCIDRGNLATAAPLMQDELHLSALAMGWAAGSIAALFVFEIVGGCACPGVFAIPQIMAGPVAAGRWVGVQNAAGYLAGMIAPAVTGVLVDQTGLFDVAFALAGAVNILGLIGWLFLLPQIAPLTWTASAAAKRVAPAPSVG